MMLCFIRWCSGGGGSSSSVCVRVCVHVRVHAEIMYVSVLNTFRHSVA